MGTATRHPAPPPPWTAQRAGQWYFVRRKPLPWYAADMLERPTGRRKIRWPDMPHAAAPVPAAYPTWAAFWNVQGT